MEQLGVGGVLSFDERPGVQGMTRAAKALGSLEGQFGGFRNKIAAIGSQFSNLGGGTLASFAGAAAAGFGLQQAISLGQNYEDLQLSMAGKIKALGFAPTFVEGKKAAEGALVVINKLAAALPGEADDYIQVFNTSMTAAKTAGFTTLDSIAEFTSNLTAIAIANQVAAGQAAADIPRLLGGHAGQDVIMWTKLQAQIGMTAEEWNSLTDMDRGKRLQAIIANNAEMLEASAATLSAQLGTVQSYLTAIAREGTRPIFEQAKVTIQSVGEWLDRNKQTLKEIVTMASGAAVTVFQRLVSHGERLWVVLQDVYHNAIEPMMDKLDKSVGLNNIKEVTATIAEIGLGISLVIPLIGILGAAIGPIMTGFSAIGSVFGLIQAGVMGLGPALLTIGGALLGPVGIALLVVGGLFLAMRRDGEGFFDTLSRIWTDNLMPMWEGVKAGFAPFVPEILLPMKEAWDSITGAFGLLMSQFSSGIETNSTGSRSFGETVGNVFAAIAMSISTVIGWFGTMLSFIVYVASNIKYAFLVVGQRLGETFGAVFGIIQNIGIAIYNFVTAPIRGMMMLIAEVLEKIASFSAGRKALAAIGIDDASGTANNLRGLAETTKENYLGISDGFGKLPDSPEETMRKDEDRKLRETSDAALKASQAALDLKRADTMGPKDLMGPIQVTSKTIIDGKTIAQTQATYQTELKERAGASSTPWQRRAVLTRAAN